MAIASDHRVKWSVNTRIHTFPLAVWGRRPTRSIANLCHGRPAYSRCLLEVGAPALCLACWHTSQDRTVRRTSLVIPGQYQLIWTLFNVRPTPLCAWRCVSHITFWRIAGGQTATIFILRFSVMLAVKTPFVSICKWGYIFTNLLSSVLPTCKTSFLISLPFATAW